MAEKPFSKEQLNFFKFSTLVLDEFPKVLRQIFVTMWDNKVSVKSGFIPWDDSTTVRNMLLTSEGGKTDIPTGKSIKEWECTALFKATIYAKTFGVPTSKGSTLNDLYLKKVKPAPGSFHSSVQSSTGNQDETYALAIDQLRLLRNLLCHSPKSEIIKSDFDAYVQLVTNALTAVNVDASFVDVVGEMNEDDFPTGKVQELEESRLKELQATSMFHDSIEQKLYSIEKQTGRIEDVEQKLSCIKERTDELQMMAKRMNFCEKGNSDTLPKSYIPSAVPFFTGRQVEIEEISNQITDQATRLLNIWGSPGFGKTSTAIGAAHHLVSLGYPVYFFKLQGIITIDDFLSKVLGIFKSNLVDHGIKPIDKVVSIFREISCRIVLIFDNLDDLLLSESRSAKLKSVFEELLDSNVNISMMFTTRELFENLRDHLEGFQAIRIRPLHPVSSIAFVHQLLPAFSKNAVAKVAEICSHVPLAMKLVASLVENNTEDMATEILRELSLSGDLFGKIDSPYEKNMKKIFEILFEQLKLSEKHALISLTVFRSSRISRDAAVGVASGEMGVAEGIRSLKTLVRKSLIDEDSTGENYSIHPIIYSFILNIANPSDFENVFNSSTIRYCSYYLLLFERLNDDFLAGKSIESPQLQDVMEHLLIVIHQAMTSGLQNLEDLFRVLSKSEIFLFLVGFPWVPSLHIPKLYDLAIEKCSAPEYNDARSKLYVSKYFNGIIFSFFVSSIHFDIPKNVRKNVKLSSDGSAAKLGCYEGISHFVNGNIKSGVEQIEEHLDDLQSCPDQHLIKCLCLQLLALYYLDLKEHSKYNKLSREAIEVCQEIGNYNLFLISDCEESLLSGQDKCRGEQLILFVHLLFSWSPELFGDETTIHLLNLLQKFEVGNKPLDNSHYLFSLVTYLDCNLAILGKIAGQEFLFDERINFLDKSLKSELTDKTFLKLSEAGTQLPRRLLSCYTIKMALHNDLVFPEGNSVHTVEMCRNALDLSIKLNGKQHEDTAFCYLKMGLAEKAAENYIAALDAFDQVIEILKTVDDGNSKGNCNCNDILVHAYVEKGEVYKYINKFNLAVESFEEALRMKSKLFGEDTKEMAVVLLSLGTAQLQLNDFTSAQTSLQRALKMMDKIATC